MSLRPLAPVLLLSTLGLACSGGAITSTSASASDGATEGSTGAATAATEASGGTAATEATGTTGEVVCEVPGGELPLGPCNPIDPSLCALPFPSNFYTVPAETESGVRLSLADTSLPPNNADVPFNPTYLNEHDGFSVLTPLVFQLPGATLDGTVGHEDLAAYLSDDAKTILVDVDTGERIPHFIELDAGAKTDEERLLIIYPVTPLRHGARHVVGVRGLVGGDGEPVAASPGFTALRECAATDDPDILGQRAHYEEAIFPVLADAGFPRGELQLAWDFTTISRASSLGRMEWIRGDVLDAIGPEGPKYTDLDVEEHDCQDPSVSIGRTIIATMVAPLYTVEDAPGTMLTRDPDGMPFRNGETEVEVMVRVPCSLLADPKPARIVQYGHGLFGGYGEAKNGYLSKMADDNGWLIVASNWTGMADDDTLAIVAMILEDISDFPMIPERSMQGFAQKIAALRMVRGHLAEDAALTVDGVSLVDPEHVSYYGNSQGGILGGAYLALSPDLHRGVLGVGGTPYALLLPRSADFSAFFSLFKMSYDDQREILLLLVALQTLWDPGEAAGWIHAMKDPGPGIPDKEVLLQVGIGDAQVTTLGAHVMARGYGASTVAPETRPLFGIDEAAPGFTGNGLVEWLYTDVPPEPLPNIPPDKDFDPHECPRREAAAQHQLADFLRDGVVNQYCEGEGGKCIGLRAVTCP
ncbi:MAG: hypothetical protein H6711_33505 [Myxococcales bacterium]|nr:hypothetical protein [Myxococcales bacterium]